MLKGRKTRKAVAAFFLVVFLTNTFAPTAAYALTSGPTTPEATSFEPIDTTDMVNLQTGDLAYNIPLIEVPGPEGGYPLSLSYHAGIKPNEDASWVGLGWSLNPGAIARNVNGYPDDWNNVSQVRRDYWEGGATSSYNIGVSVGISGPVNGVSFGLSISQDTYRGFGVGFDLGFSFKLAKNLGLGINVGLSPYGDPYASAGLDYKFFSTIDDEKNVTQESLNLSASIGIATNFKSIDGFGGLSASYRSGLQYNDEDQTLTGMTSYSLLGLSMSTGGNKPSLSAGGFTSNAGNSNGGRIQTESSGFGANIPISAALSISLGYNYRRYWSDETVTVPTFGSLNMSGVTLNSEKTFDTYSLLDYPNFSIAEYTDPAYVQGGAYPNFDNYSVTAQGLSGNFRPYLYQGYMAGQKRKNNSGQTLVQYYIPGATDPANGPITHANPKFRFINDFSNQLRQATNDFTNINSLKNTAAPFDSNPTHGNNDGNYGGAGTDNSLAGSKHIEYVLYNSVMEGSSSIPPNGFVRPTNAYGLSLGAVNSSDPMYSQIAGFSITNESGVTYHYGLPVYSFSETTYSEKIDKSAGNGHSGSWNRLSKPAKYAYMWCLTSITGADFVDRNGNGKADDNDWGYWVNMEYGKWADAYYWRNPSEGFQRDIDNEFQGNSKGGKEVYYLNAVRTRSHTAFFVKDIRKDAKSISWNIMPQFSYEPDGLFDGSSVSTLALKKVLLFSNDKLPAYDPVFLYPPNWNSYVQHHGENVVDIQDVPNSANSIRVIDFNYDYSLASGTVNSYEYANAAEKLGKLTLKSLTFKGREGQCMIPPIKFDYELSPTEAKTASITIQNDISNAEGTIVTVGLFSEGDIISFSVNGIAYNAVIKKIVNASTFKVRYINAVPPVNSVATATTTKNPLYNKDAYDMWNMYKSDFDSKMAFGPPGNASIGNENLARMTSTISSKSTDAWSLRKVTTSVGASIKIDYESDDYQKAVLNGDDYSLVANNVERVSGFNNRLKITVSDVAYGLNLSDFYTLGNPMNCLMLLRNFDPNSILASSYPLCGWSLRNFTFDVYDTKASANLTNVVEIGTDYIVVENPDFGGFFITPVQVHNTQGQLISSSCGTNKFPTMANLAVANRPVLYGGGIRVKKLSINSEDNSTNSINYKYTTSSNNFISSGVTSFEPFILDNAYVFNYNAQTVSVGKKIYQKKLYENINYLLSMSREVPPPGVLYEFVSVQNEVTNQGELSRQIEGKSVYQFEVFKSNMISRTDVNLRGSSGNNSTHNLALKNFSTRIGNVKRIINYGLKSPGSTEYIKLSETINHYLNDEVSDVQPEGNFYSLYEQKLSQFNFQGIIKERYVEVKDTRNFLDLSNSTMYTKATFATREEFPSVMTEQTVVNYHTGSKTTTQNVGFDFYSGAVNKKVETDALGNRFMSVMEPAYKKYPSMGLKVGNYRNKNMLTQTSANYTYKVDINNNPTGLIASNVQTWSNDVYVTDINNNQFQQNDNAPNTVIGNIWRPKMTYSWLPDGASSDGLTSIGVFADFDWNNQNIPSAQNAGWKKTGEISLYNVFSKALEFSDVNGNFTASKMGYNHSKLMISGAPAKYSELVYSGAEDKINPQTGMFGDVQLGNGTIINDPANSHTGVKSVTLPTGGYTGMTYNVPVHKLQQGREYFASVWVKSSSGGAPTANSGLYYSVNNGPIVLGTVTVNAGQWYQVNLRIPTNTLNTNDQLQIGCINSSSEVFYFDDFRFSPLDATVASYVYDDNTGELTYILDNNNIYTRFEYDAVGRLIKTYRETSPGGLKILNEYFYNYNFPETCQNDPIPTIYWNDEMSQPFTKNDCPSGQTGTTVTYTIPANTYSSTISKLDANILAALILSSNGQSYANSNGTCTSPPGCSGTSPIYARLELGPYYNAGDCDGEEGYLRFYCDANCTMPLTLTSSLQVKYLTTEYPSGSNYITTITVGPGTNEYYLGFLPSNCQFCEIDPQYGGWVCNYWSYLYDISANGSLYTTLPIYYY